MAGRRRSHGTDHERGVVKAADPSGVFRAQLGRVTPNFSADTRDRATMRGLANRYFRWVKRCVDLNASTCAAVQPKLYTIDTTGELVNKTYGGRPLARSVDVRTKAFLTGRLASKPSNSVAKAMCHPGGEVVEVTNSPLLDLLDDVNPYTEGFAFRESMYADLQLFGRSFSLLVGPGVERGAAPTSMQRMLPQLTQVVPDPVNFIRGFVYGTAPDQSQYQPDEVLWLRMPDPSDMWGGVGPLEAWAKTVDADWAMTEFQAWYFAKGGMPEVVVNTAAKMDVPEQRSMSRMLAGGFGNMMSRARRAVAFTTGSMTIERFDSSPKDMQFTQGREITRDEIGQAFGVPKSMLTTDDVNMANGETANAAYISHTIWPMIRRVEDKLNQTLVPRYGDRLFLAHENPVREDREHIRAERASKLGSGYSLNEVRISECVEPIDDPAADMPLVAAGLTTLEKLTMPAPPPMLPPADDDEPDDGELEDDELELEDGEPTEKSVGPLIFKQSEMVMGGDCGCMAVRKAGGASDLARGSFTPPDNPGMAASILGVFMDIVEEVASKVEERAGLKAADKNDAGSLVVALPEWIRRMAKAVTPHVGDALAEGGRRGVERVGVEISFDLANRRAQEYVERASGRIGTQITETLADRVRGVVVEGLDEGLSAGRLAERLRGIGLGNKAEMVARTETAFAQMEGTVQGWEQSGVVTGKQFILAPDACPFCESVAAEFEDRTLRLREPFKPLGSTIGAEVDGRPALMKVDYVALNAPPVHPNCRCDLEPVIDEEFDF